MATLEMERRLKASRAEVFRFLTEGENLLQWWGPEGTTIPEHNLDFASLGPWWARMVGPSGDGAKVGGDVVRLEPPTSVELTLSFFHEDGSKGPQSVIKFELFSEGPEETRLCLTQTGLEAEHIEDMRNKGWNSALERLATLVHSHQRSN
ncbi:SRPBCC domain-containing protein [Halocynthiibacter sp. C4]|uniref:SRPBCC family protein n=1 Tax=Halocynthiibacter sp. C4 TaxID=2992758 RepID=UPI00237B9FDA|nr:SRPBCC domain-containing protein [Halocynthiibacter sp. C4]MDE0590134.1 SRPBCC domain-containing protein [Halocynthiibacter sp. C4]